MKAKIDWGGTLYLSTVFGFWISFLTDINNIVSCIETSKYQVGVCEPSVQFYLSYILGAIWLVWTIKIVIELVCVKWEGE